MEGDATAHINFAVLFQDRSNPALVMATMSSSSYFENFDAILSWYSNSSFIKIVVQNFFGSLSKVINLVFCQLIDNIGFDCLKEVEIIFEADTKNEWLIEIDLSYPFCWSAGLVRASKAAADSLGDLFERNIFAWTEGLCSALWRFGFEELDPTRIIYLLFSSIVDKLFP